MSRIETAILLTVIIFMLPACGKKIYHSDWSAIEHPRFGQNRGVSQVDDIAANKAEVNRLYARAMGKLEQAADLESITIAMELMQQVLRANPNHREALTSLGNMHILLGTAFTNDRDKKLIHFQQAMAYCEASMYLNPQFRKAVQAGSKPWEASHTLQKEDAPAMLFWVIALQYEFKETMAWPAKIINVGWLQHGITFLDRIKQVAPDYGNGAVEFSYSICYLALPTFLGGDKERGKSYLNQSIALGQDYLLPRWGKGKYYHQVTGDLEDSRKDLNWVARQDPKNYKDIYPWRIHFITDAKLQLASLQKR